MSSKTKPDVPMRRLRVSLSHAWPVVIIYLVLMLMFTVLAVVNPSFPSAWSVTNLMLSALPLAFAAVAQTAVILVKGIDLSVGPAISLVMVIAASLMQNSPWSIAGTLCLCLLVGLAVGAVNGLLVVQARLQPIIVTLATSSVLAGLALYIMPQPGGYIPPILGSVAGGTIAFVPVPLVVLLATLLLWLLLRQTRIGQGWYAVGGNESGAFYSGVPVKTVKLAAFLVAGLFAALGGLTLAAQTLTGDPMIGAPYTLNSIAAAVLGGTSLAGGRGGAIGAVGGALVLTVVVDILFFFNVSAYYQYVFTGAILILALAAAALSGSLQSRRVFG